jgi:hypothetical protein
LVVFIQVTLKEVHDPVPSGHGKQPAINSDEAKSSRTTQPNLLPSKL